MSNNQLEKIADSKEEHSIKNPFTEFFDHPTTKAFAFITGDITTFITTFYVTGWWQGLVVGIFIVCFIGFLYQLSLIYARYIQKQNSVLISLIPTDFEFHQSEKKISLDSNSDENQRTLNQEIFPTILIRKVELDISITENDQKLIFDNVASGKNGKAYAIEFRFKPTVNISGSIVLEASIQIDDQPPYKAYWLKTWKTETELSVGELDNLIIAVKESDNLYKYSIYSHYADVEVIPYGEYNQLTNNTVFKVEYFAKQNGKVFKAEILELTLSRINKGKNRGKIFYDFIAKP